MTASGGYPQPGDATEISQRLLAWYERCRRDLPWRRTQDPYAIWVAEIILQQTRVETASSYYERFLARFPTLESLAAAQLDDVLKAWEGLGYYARARNLHAAARWLLENQGGGFHHCPRAAEPAGIGCYTAAAIASIAFGQDTVALDGNLERVLCRIFSIDDDPGRPNTRRVLEQLGLSIILPGRAGELNQALMDLGALICTPSRPRCLICPWWACARRCAKGSRTTCRSGPRAPTALIAMWLLG